MATKPNWQTCRPRTAEAILDRISRTRALTLPESLALEKAIKAQNGESLDELCRAAAKFTRVSVEEIKAKFCTKNIARARAAVMLAAHERRISLPVIAAYFRRKDHTSCWSARHRAAMLEQTEPSFARLMAKLRAVE